jgi:hypothetical protein
MVVVWFSVICHIFALAMESEGILQLDEMAKNNRRENRGGKGF